jgi:aldehyde dehydrogenase (NAD+)
MSTSLLERGISQPSGRHVDLPLAAGLAYASSPSIDAQMQWAALPVASRLRVLKKARHLLASRTEALCAAIPSTLSRNSADTYCAEIIPLLSACKFLEQESAAILKPRSLGRRGLPLWLAGIRSEVHRVALGRVLVIAPSNYPLFLPGAQVLQALAAGNAVLWKPGIGGRKVASLVAETIYEAGLPRDLLQVAEESVEAAQAAIARGVDKVFFTGSATSGRILLRQLAETLTPCVAELSGCDSVLVLPSADLSRVVKALSFGMRLNGSATCMAPRRVILVGADTSRREALIAQLKTAFDAVRGVSLPAKVQRQLHILIGDAIEAGALVHGVLQTAQQPLLVTDATPAMQIAQADIFAPVLTLLEARDTRDAIAINEACPYALTVSIFGDEAEARALANMVTAGTVIVNDLMIPAADPRTPFGGRKQSGFGVTQGAEGLLEMTAPKTIVVRRGSSTRNFDATTDAHRRLFEGVVQASHAATLKQRIAGLRQMIATASRMK